MRKHNYLYPRLVGPPPTPYLSIVRNHALDDAAGLQTFERVHGPTSFTFANAHTRFVALNAAPGVVGEVVLGDNPEALDDTTLAFLDTTLEAADEPNRVVLMHMPPHLNGHY